MKTMQMELTQEEMLLIRDCVIEEKQRIKQFIKERGDNPSINKRLLQLEGLKDSFQDFLNSRKWY